MRSRVGFAVIGVMGLALGGAAAAEAPVDEAVRKAAAAYADAYNKRDFKALGEHWADNAELAEGGARVVGRDQIVASIRGWLERHPQAKLAIQVGDIAMVSPSLARVRGTMLFTKRPGEKPVESRFESLRVREGDAWRLAESTVAPNHAAALDDLGWLLGTWQATDAQDGTVVEATFEKVAGGYAILGRTKVKPKAGPAVESIDVIHADRAAGVVRSLILDSTGALAEGVFQADGTGFNRVLSGTPADSMAGSRAEWVQVIMPGGDGRFTLQSIERSLDGRRMPDGAALNFKKIR